MLEALVDIRHDRETDLKRRGDILAIKPAGSVWSDAEKRFHKVFQWEDTELETRIRAIQKRGEKHPVISLPYATWDRDRLEMTSRSTQFVNIDAMQGDLKRDILDRQTKVETIRADVLGPYRNDRGERLAAPRIFRVDDRPRILTGHQFRILAATVSEIRPSGGGDYTTLAAWEAFADGQASGDQWAECYTGGDLGYVELNGWTGTINASTYPRVYGAAGNRHDGDITAGCYATGISATYISSRVDYVEIDGLRFSGHDRRVFIREADNNTFKNCLVETNGGTYQNVLITACLNALVYNNILTGGSYGIFFNAIAAGSCTGAAYNNTIYNSTRGIHLNEDANTCAITAKNNILLSNGTADVSYGSGTPTLTSDYNLISDATLTSLGVKGSNDIESATLAAVLRNAASDNFFLAAGSAGLNSGLDLSATIEAVDAAGTARPQSTAWDRGALETISDAVAASDTSHGHTVDFATIGEVHPVAASDTTHTHTADASAIAETHPIVARDASHTHTADAAAITSVASISPAGASHTHTADASAITSTDSIAVQDASHGQTADSVLVSEVHTIACSDASHTHTADSATVSGVHAVAVAAASHGHTAGDVLVSEVQTITPAPATHGHTADAVAITAYDLIAVADATHAHTAAGVEIITPLLTLQIDTLSYYTPGLARGSHYTPGLEAGAADVPGLAKGSFSQG